MGCRYRALVGIVGATALCLALAGGCGKAGKTPEQGTTTPTPLKTTTVESNGVKFEVPEGSPTEIKATVIAEPESLAKVDRGAKVCAATVLEPEGTQYVNGLKVTWPLRDRRQAGEKLYVAILDENTRKWYGTGETAEVAGDGEHASGMVWHFSTYSLVDKDPAEMAPSGKPVVVDRNGGFSSEKKDQEPYEAVAHVRTHGTAAVVVSSDTKKKTMEAYKAITDANGKTGKMTLDQFKKFVGSTDYATVKSLIESGDISPEHNRQLGDWRIYLLMDSIKDFCAKNPGTKVYRSDTGNQKNAYLSDVDQTLFVYKYEDGVWKRVADLDGAVKQHTQERLQGQGLSMEKMEVETMLGKDHFLDERIVSAEADKLLSSDLAGKKRGIVITYANVALSRQPGAYFLAGTVKQLQQLRVADQASKHLQGTIHPDDRAIEISETKEMLGRLNGQVCTEIGPSDENPKGEVGVREGSYEKARDVLMDGLEPELQRGWAYDSTVDNWFKFNEKVKYALDPHKAPAVKYVLRSVNNGPAMLASMDNKMGFVEYEKLNDAQRKQFLIHCYGADLAAPREMAWRARDGSSLLDRWKIVLDISAEIRNAKGGMSEAQLKEAFRPLAEKLAGPGNWEEYLGLARNEYNARCQEIMTHNMVMTSRERIMGWLTPDPNNPKNREEMIRHIDETEIRRAYRMEGPEWDAKWASMRGEIFGNHADTARLQLLFSFRYMDKTVIKTILEQAARNKKLSPADVEKIRNLASEATSPLFHYRRAKEVPTLYMHIIGEWSKYSLDKVQKRLKDWVLEDIGWTDPAKGERAPSPAAKKLGLGGMDDAVQDFFRKYNRTAGFGARFIRNMTMDIGNADSVAQVLRTWSESGGDPEAIQEAIVTEMVNQTPVLGQVLSVTRIKNGWDAAQMGGLMACAMYTPYGRYTMILWSIGESGVAMYQSDYRAPMSHAVADTLYRGYAGPSLYEFGQTPAQFTDANQAELDQVKSDLKMMKLTLANKEEIGGLVAREQALSVKKERWKGYVVEQSRNEGGTLTGTAAQLVQKPLELEGNPEFPDEPKWMGGPMLARVTPQILFTATKEGPVDFTVPELTPAERSRMEELKKQMDTEKNPGAQFDVARELEKLVVQDEMNTRAQRYLERARTNRELMHQIRLDSIWPYMEKDKSNDMVDANFTDNWIDLRRDKIVAALGKLGIEADYKAIRDAKEELKERFLEDVQRSKQRWEDYDRFRKAREKTVDQYYENAKVNAAVEAMMMWAEDKTNNFSASANAAFAEAGLDPEYTAGLEYLGEAVVNRHRPISPATVKITARVLKGDPEAQKEEDKEDLLVPEVKVVADPSVFVQPYSYAVYVLGRNEAKSTAASKTYQGLPVSDEMVKGLNEYLEKVPEPQKKDGKDAKTAPVYLVYSFCADYRLPDRVVPGTTAKVARLMKYAIPGQGKDGYLLGGATIIAEAQPKGPFTVTSRRPKTTSIATELVVQSDNIEALDQQKPYTQLQYMVYVSNNPDGPWLNNNGPYSLSQKTKVEEDGPYPTYKRIAKDKYVLGDGNVLEVIRKNGWEDRPIYYRVGEAWVLEGKAQKEALSDVIMPGHSEIVLSWLDKSNWTNAEIVCPNETLSFIEVGVGPENQAYQCPGAHVTVFDGVRTTHYWTARREGNKRFGSEQVKWNWAHIDVPTPPGGMTLEIAGDLQGETAKPRKVKVTPTISDKARTSMQKYMDDMKKRYADRQRMLQQDVKRANEELADINKQLADKPKEVPPEDAWRYASLERKQVRLRNWINIMTQCMVPFETKAEELETDFQKGDFKPIAELVKQLWDLRKKEMDLKVADVNERIALLGPNDKSFREDLDKELKKAQDDYRDFMTMENIHGPYDSLHGCVFNGVYFSGDSALLKKMYEARLEAKKAQAKEKNYKDPYIADDLKRYGEWWAELTGDREKAAELYTEGYRLSGNNPPLEQREDMPPWWPVGKGAGAGKPAGK